MSSCETEQKTIYIYVDGACTNNNIKDTSKRKAAYGIFVDKGDQITYLPKEEDVDRTLPPREQCFFVSEKVPQSRDYPPTNNRAEILAAVRALELLLSNSFPVACGEKVTFINDSKYVHSAVTDWLPRIWRLNDYRKSDGGDVLNVDLIRRLDNALLRLEKDQQFSVTWERVNSHQREPQDKTSHSWRMWYGNDFADRLANLACGKNQFQKKTKKKEKEEDEEGEDAEEEEEKTAKKSKK